MSQHPISSLVGDIGGTHARFALASASGQPLTHALTLATADHADLAGAAQAYLERVGRPAVKHASIAIANPITGDWLQMTNTAWAFSIEETRRQLGLDGLRMLNDWEAMALAAPAFQPHELEAIGGGTPVEGAPRGLLGAGTGLGVSSLVRSPSGEWVPVAGEGGHVTLAPTCEREADILRVLWRSFVHVSAERVISGMGLENLYRAICELDGLTPEPLVAADVTARGLAGSDVACEEAVATLCRLFGSVAGNLALTLGARGGIYIGGGVVGHLGGYLARSQFRQAFEAKGRFEEFLRQVPVWVIRAPQPALRGAAMALGIRACA